MKNERILFFLLSLCAVFSVCGVSKSLHIPRAGDKLEICVVDFSDTIASGENCLWDLSKSAVSGLDLYDFEVRQYDSTIGRFRSQDLFSEIYYPMSPYLYCIANPLVYIDPNGETTYVEKDGNKYVVVGGVVDNCSSLVLRTKTENGEFLFEKIGETIVATSFYNSDSDTWSGVIDPNDTSGMQFLNSIFTDPPCILSYINNARNHKIYDFKNSNGGLYSENGLDHYRGMLYGCTEDNLPIFVSARDVGNIAAGYVSAVYGLSWELTRLGFDVYQSIVSGKITLEGLSSQNAQRVGFAIGESRYQDNIRKIKNDIKKYINKIYENVK